MPFLVVIVLLLAAGPARAQANTEPRGDGGEVSTEDVIPVRVPAPVAPGPAGVWEAYRPQVIGLIVLQTALIAALLLQQISRRRVETALRESREQYLLASAAGAVGIWDWDIEKNTLFIDVRLKSILGFADSEISTRPDDWGSRVHPEDLPASTAAVQACIDGASDTYQVEHRMIHKDGGIKWMLSRGSAIRGPDGKLRRLVGTKVDITERRNAEEASRESRAILEASNRENHDLAGRLITSQEGERARLARDLHDDLSQQLAGLSIALSAFRRRLTAAQHVDDLQTELTALQMRTLGIADNIRRLSHDLHPSVLQHAGLVTALRDHCADIGRWHRVDVALSVDGDFASTDPGAALCLYRVAQEALRNVVAHAAARRVEVRLLRAGHEAQLTIADDGRGFDIRETGRKGSGLGLVSIAERVRLAGGSVSIVTELSKGTRVSVQIPANGHVLAASAT